MEESKNTTPYFIGMVVAMLFWGIAWTAGKMAAEHSNAEVAAFWRYAISFVTIIPVVWYMKIPLKTDKIGFLYMLGAGLLTSLFNYLFFAGLSHGQAGYGGTMVTALAPIFTYLMSIAVLGTKVSNRQVFAFSIGLFGALILLRVPFEGFAFLNMESSYFLECAIVWAAVTILSQKASKRAHIMFYTVVVFGITGFTNMLFALPYHPFDFGAYDSVFWYTILFIGVLPGTFSTALFFLSAGKIGAHRTGVFMFIVPIGAIISSWIVYDEQIALSTVLGCALAFVAVLLFNMKKSSKV
ncbi:MAG: DMT family transporter [Epsilonproteobacteria bacterium]|mgnify:CR=1 FL=1|nr:DMT family transporter [Campylobacterota bacterium]OIO16114.1 MAG: EamA family transporter [Helicobacteraceae bacterium CG1_02_36_14]PIP10173.1 MAG: EamA family transporter [Sulfurimonas sp. CG23_combo_of_CG06-09_8_20_14_all_36_33]PIS26507.1 MAG: EamA/RhaT family transporter [Sulfurimonas sp. CG08_land_8_20_14_0_20_36_33]PIU33969.1 MAG: EamA/RhaT family transporter [Sulfurimonas sp. CG07_land_8_20_14_0_80_36_56]PIV03797.1 MAG: EamA/RhaT family transporter [Sulfurimonas sp. CG03_land_8_20_14